jgi:hypothetical protein
MTLHVYWTSVCAACPMKAQCTPGKERRARRWEHEAVIDAMQARLDREPEKIRLRRQTVEHPYGTIKAWMGATHFLTKTLARVSTEMSLACTRLQPQPRGEDPGRPCHDRSDPGVGQNRGPTTGYSERAVLIPAKISPRSGV